MKDAIATQLTLLKWYLIQKREDTEAWLAFHLPHSIVYWAGIRMVSNASERNPTTEIHEITAPEVLNSWGIRK